jgi:hypothetical protein
VTGAQYWDDPIIRSRRGKRVPAVVAKIANEAAADEIMTSSMVRAVVKAHGVTEHHPEMRSQKPPETGAQHFRRGSPKCFRSAELVFGSALALS